MVGFQPLIPAEGKLHDIPSPCSTDNHLTSRLLQLPAARLVKGTLREIDPGVIQIDEVVTAEVGEGGEGGEVGFVLPLQAAWPPY